MGTVIVVVVLSVLVLALLGVMVYDRRRQAQERAEMRALVQLATRPPPDPKIVIPPPGAHPKTHVWWARPLAVVAAAMLSAGAWAQRHTVATMAGLAALIAIGLGVVASEPPPSDMALPPPPGPTGQPPTLTPPPLEPPPEPPTEPDSQEDTTPDTTPDTGPPEPGPNTTDPTDPAPAPAQSPEPESPRSDPDDGKEPGTPSEPPEQPPDEPDCTIIHVDLPVAEACVLPG